MARFIERPLTRESPIQCALSSDRGDGGARERHRLSGRRPTRIFAYEGSPEPREVVSMACTNDLRTTQGSGYPRLGGYSVVSSPGYPPKVPWGGSPGGIVPSQVGVRLERPILRVRSTTPGGPPRVHAFTPPKPRTMFVEGVFSLGCMTTPFNLYIALRAYH